MNNFFVGKCHFFLKAMRKKWYFYIFLNFVKMRNRKVYR